MSGKFDMQREKLEGRINSIRTRKLIRSIRRSIEEGKEYKYNNVFLGERLKESLIFCGEYLKKRDYKNILRELEGVYPMLYDFREKRLAEEKFKIDHLEEEFKLGKIQEHGIFRTLTYDIDKVLRIIERATRMYAKRIAANPKTTIKDCRYGEKLLGLAEKCEAIKGDTVGTTYIRYNFSRKNAEDETISRFKAY